MADTDEESFYEPSYYEPSEASETSSTRSKKKKRSEKRGPRIFTINKWATLEVTRNGKTEEQRYRKKINVFETPSVVNHIIINASTGYGFTSYSGKDIRVGTEDEDDLFKVKMISGEDGCPACQLYYDSPESYERHMMTELSTDIKKKWTERNTIYKQRMLRKYQ